MKATRHSGCGAGPTGRLAVGVVVALWVLCAWAAGVGAQQPPEEAGGQRADRSGGAADSASAKTVVRLEMRCDLQQCDNPAEIDRFLDIAGLYPGAEWSDQRRRVARQRLEKTGLFTSVSYTVEEVGADGVAVQVEADGATRIRDIEFKGVSPPPFRSDLRKLLVYRQGEAYEENPTKRNAQLNSLEEAFKEGGFFGTSIEMKAAYVGKDRKLVDITFRIDKGQRLTICDIGLRGVRALSYAEARRRLLSDLPLFSSRIELLPPRFTTDAFEAGQKALVERYRQLGYFRARIIDDAARKDLNEGCVTLMVDVEEGPRWALEFKGNQAVGRAALKKELPFYASGYVDAEEIERAERAIRELYETRGHPFAKVEGVEKRIDRLNRRLVFRIDEGPRLEVDELVFHGNEVISDDVLAEGLGTRPFELFATGGFVQTAQLLGDIRRIEQRYRDRGYLRAEVERYELAIDRRSGEVDVHLHIEERQQVVTGAVRFDGVRSLTRARLRRRVKIRSNDPFVPVQLKADDSRIDQLYSSVGYPLGNVTTRCRLLDGSRVACDGPRRPARCVATSVAQLEERCYWTEDRSRYVCRRIGRPRDIRAPSERQKEQEATEGSSSEGADDPPDEAGGNTSGDDASEGTAGQQGDAESEPCAFTGGIGDAEVVRVIHAINEGPVVSAGEFLIQGNFRTRDAIIRRELPLETGDIFDVRKILQGQSNLRSLGIFNSVSIEAIGLDEEAKESREHEAALLINVEESTNRFFEFKVGLEGRDLLGEQQKLLTTAEVEYNDKNVFGRALQMRPHVFGALDVLQVGERIQGAAGQLDYLMGAELVFRHPRFLKGAFGVDKLNLTVTPFYLIDLLGVANDQLLREEWGLRMEVRKELSEILERLYFSFGLEGKQAATAPVNGPKLGGERIFSPRRTTGKLIPELSLDRRDSPLSPSKGYFLKFTPEYVTGDALSPQVSTFEDSYFRFTFTGDFFVPLWESMVLAQRVKFGQIVPVAGRSTRVPPDERYFLGGAGSVRGFPNNSLGPTLDDQPTGGELALNYNLEVRYPLIPGANLQGATFFDAGILVDCFDDANLGRRTSCYADAFGSAAETMENLRTAAGVGLRYVIGDQIPLLFDWGIALDRQQGEGFGNLHFHLGYTF